MNYPKFIFKLCIILAVIVKIACGALIDGKLGTVTSSATLKTTYDSRVFAMSSNQFKDLKNNDFTNSEIESEDDFIVSFSPSLHFATKVGLLKLQGSAGVNIVQYLINEKKSYIVPTTSLSLDFDDTLALKKRISNNAKIRFESTFDLGQVVGASVLEQDLVAYTYISTGFNVRYNHSEKFGLGGGTNYSYRFYQTERHSDGKQPNFDFSTLPLSARAFYIYSEKLDFFVNYSFSRTKSDNKGQDELTSSSSHSISIGADGQFSSKLSGSASIGYSVVDFANPETENQDNIITALSATLKHNSKTSSNINLSRSFSPTSTGASTFTTSLGYGLNHRFTEDWSGGVNVTAGFTEFTSIDKKPYDLSSYGFGFTTSKILSRYFTLSGGYSFTFTDGGIDVESYDRHVIFAQLTGRF